MTNCSPVVELVIDADRRRFPYPAQIQGSCKSGKDTDQMEARGIVSGYEEQTEAYSHNKAVARDADGLKG